MYRRLVEYYLKQCLCCSHLFHASFSFFDMLVSVYVVLLFFVGIDGCKTGCSASTSLPRVT
jgi:hypothetical protein